MKWLVPTGNGINDKRKRAGFLWFPLCINGLCRWLERAEWEEEYFANYADSGWSAVRWLDIDKDKNL